jgi:hypothetical protein
MGYKINKTMIKKAIPGTFGIYNQIAKNLGVDRALITKYMQKYPDLKSLAEEEKYKMVDLAKSKAIIKINEGDTTSIWKTLQTLGKSEGFGETQKLEHSGEITNKIDKIEVEVIKRDNETKDTNNKEL